MGRKVKVSTLDLGIEGVGRGIGQSRSAAFWALNFFLKGASFRRNIVPRAPPLIRQPRVDMSTSRALGQHHGGGGGGGGVVVGSFPRNVKLGAQEGQPKKA